MEIKKLKKLKVNKWQSYLIAFIAIIIICSAGAVGFKCGNVAFAADTVSDTVMDYVQNDNIVTVQNIPENFTVAGPNKTIKVDVIYFTNVADLNTIADINYFLSNNAGNYTIKEFYSSATALNSTFEFNTYDFLFNQKVVSNNYGFLLRFKAVVGTAQGSNTYISYTKSFRYDYQSKTIVKLPEEPTKEGYTFIGWYYDEALTQPYNGEEITEDTQFYAKFEINKYTLNFYFLNEKVHTATDVVHGTDIHQVYNFEREHYSGFRYCWDIDCNCEFWIVDRAGDVYIWGNCDYWTVKVMSGKEILDTVIINKDFSDASAMGEIVTEKIPIGYKVSGYYYKSDFSDTPFFYAKDNFDSMNNDYTVYAKLDVKMCQVEFFVFEADGSPRHYCMITVPYGAILKDYLQSSGNATAKAVSNTLDLENLYTISSTGDLVKFDTDMVITDDFNIQADVLSSLCGWLNFGAWWIKNWIWVLIGIAGAIVLGIIIVVIYKRS